MIELLAYITCKDEEEAVRIANALLGERFVGCCNIIPEIRSLYWWKGKIQDDKECLLLCKTLDKKQEGIIKKVRELHSYTVPCIEFIHIRETNKEYANWLYSEMAKK